jgi:hypothetical protein
MAFLTIITNFTGEYSEYFRDDSWNAAHGCQSPFKPQALRGSFGWPGLVSATTPT